MIHTVSSNAFEVLEAALLVNIEFDLKAYRENGTPFETIPIVTPGDLTADRLSRAMAEHFGVTPGVEFMRVGRWLMTQHAELTLGFGAMNDALIWQLWALLTSPQEGAFWQYLREHVPAQSLERLTQFLDGKSGQTTMDFVYQLRNLYTTYSSYRLDWLLHWAEPRQYPLKAGEQAAMDMSPDSGWIAWLWRYLYENGLNPNQWRGATDVQKAPEQLTDKRFKREYRHRAVHFFTPRSIPPLLLPLIRAHAKDPNAPDIWLYTFNPSEKYWFDPSSALTGETLDEMGQPAQNYLALSAASLRAMTDRLWRFLHASEDSIIEADDPAPQAEPEVTSRSRVLQELAGQIELDREVEAQNIFIDPGCDSLLHNIQGALLKLNVQRLPKAALEKEQLQRDQSFRVILARSPKREFEVIADLLHTLFNDRTLALAPSEVLVAVADINQAAPIIEGVFSSLPDQMRLPWRIIGQSQADASQCYAAVKQFCRLVSGRFRREAFLDWLFKPVVQQRWSLGAGDVQIISRWLVEAGFRFGLDQAQLDELKLAREDGSLERALERLSLSFFLGETVEVPLFDVLPASGNADGGFDRTTDDAGRILKTLCEIFSALQKARGQLADFSAGATASEWTSLCLQWLDTFFSIPATAGDLAGLRRTLSRITEAAYFGTGGTGKMPFEVFRTVLEHSMQQSDSVKPIIGAVTFAPATAVAGLPYKVIIAAGFGEDSGFPGNPRMQDFDLMSSAALKRRADRDSRSDNRAVFLSLLLAARQRFFITYDVGASAQGDKNPSSVIEDLKTLVTSHARMYSPGAAETLWQQLQCRTPLNAFSAKNFVLGEGRFWLSPRRNLLEALELTRQNQGFPDTPVLANYHLPSSKYPSAMHDQGIVPAALLADLLANPDDWSEKQLSIKSYEHGVPTVALEPAGDALNQVLRRRAFLSQFEQGAPVEQIFERISLDPRFGIAQLRKVKLAPEVLTINKAVQARDTFLAPLTALPAEEFTWLAPTPTPKLHHVDIDEPERRKQPLVAISDTLTDLYLNPLDQSRWTVEIATSKTALVKALVRHLIRCSMGAQTNLWLYAFTTKGDQTNDTDGKSLLIPCLDVPEMFLIDLLTILAIQTQHTVAIPKKGDLSSGSVLWTGREAQFYRLQAMVEGFLESRSKLTDFKDEKSVTATLVAMPGAVHALSDTLSLEFSP